MLACAVTLVVGCVLAYLLQPMLWPTTTGVVHTSLWVNTTGNDSRGACVNYSYEVDGRVFLSDQLSLFRTANDYDAGSGQWEWDDRRLVDEHPKGSAIEVRYDPVDPSRSVVVAHPNMPGVWVAGAIIGGFWAAAFSLAGCERRRAPTVAMISIQESDHDSLAFFRSHEAAEAASR